MERANLLIRDNESVMKTKLMDKVANTSMAAAFDFYGVTYGQYVEGLMFSIRTIATSELSFTPRLPTSVTRPAERATRR
jgi:hypothetical protein